MTHDLMHLLLSSELQPERYDLQQKLLQLRLAQQLRICPSKLQKQLLEQLEQHEVLMPGRE
jgi:hypothetical protein